MIMSIKQKRGKKIITLTNEAVLIRFFRGPKYFLMSASDEHMLDTWLAPHCVFFLTILISKDLCSRRNKITWYSSNNLYKHCTCAIFIKCSPVYHFKALLRRLESSHSAKPFAVAEITAIYKAWGGGC